MLFVVAALLFGCSSDNDSNTNTASGTGSEVLDPTIPQMTEPLGLPEAAELTSIFDLDVRDCWSFVEDRVAEDTAVWVIPCERAHDGEVIAELDYDGPTGESNRYAGEQAVRDAAEAACLDTFEPYVGTRWTLSSLELMTFWPSAESWAVGDTQVICAIVRTSPEPLLGSQEGSGA